MYSKHQAWRGIAFDDANGFPTLIVRYFDFLQNRECLSVLCRDEDIREAEQHWLKLNRDDITS